MGAAEPRAGWPSACSSADAGHGHAGGVGGALRGRLHRAALGEVLARAVDLGAIALVDAYHAFNVVPVDWGPAAARLFVTAGSYKYAGFGEGLCWLRIPADCRLRPADTGWFADFDSLALPRGGEVRYGAGGARFAGSTFDASSLYRAEAALAHWERLGLGAASCAPYPPQTRGSSPGSTPRGSGPRWCRAATTRSARASCPARGGCGRDRRALARARRPRRLAPRPAAHRTGALSDRRRDRTGLTLSRKSSLAREAADHPS